MFRLALDLVTKSKLPDENDSSSPQPNHTQRSKLSPRLEWLFQQGKLDCSLREFATCIRENGNDAAHDGSLSMEDAEDLCDFTNLVLSKIYTEEAKLIEIRNRRSARRR